MAVNLRKIPDQALDAAREYFEPQLNLMHLSQYQIQDQSLDDLETSLVTVTDAIDRAPSFGFMPFDVTARTGGVLVKSKVEGILQVGILPILLERKSLILRRIATLRKEQSLNEVREELATTVSDPAARKQIAERFDEELRRALAESERLIQSVVKADEDKEKSLRLQMELVERRSAIRRSWFEKESVASIVGAVLLLVFAATLIFAMFIKLPPTEIISSAFLLILGYFFGQATGRRRAESIKNHSEE